MERFRAILRGTGVVAGVVAILLGGRAVLMLAYVFVPKTKRCKSGSSTRTTRI